MAKQFRLAAAAARLKRLLRRPSRYAQIGLVCVLLSNAVVIGLDQLGAHYLFGAVASSVAVTLVGYLLHCAYTFKVRPSRAGLMRFYAGTAIGFWLAILLMMILCDGFDLTASMAIPIASLLLFAWNFAMASWAIDRAGGSGRRNA